MGIVVGELGVLVELKSILDITLEPAFERLRQRLWEGQPSKLVGADLAADAATRSLRDYIALEFIAQRNGYNSDQFRLMVDTAQKWATPDDIMAARFRGNIDPTTEDMLWARTGIAPAARDLLKLNALVIPNVTDVVRFLTRDVFIPEFVEAFGMDQEMPPDARPYFAQLGITEEVQKLHWRAHWELPGLTAGYEMFQRGYIEEPALRRLMRAQGVEPFWRTPLIQIAYNPPRLIDIRRWRHDDVITFDEMEGFYRDRGYSPKNAHLAATSTEKQVHGDKKAALRDLSAPLRSEIANAVVAGVVNETDAREHLHLFGDTDAEISAFFATARWLRGVRIKAKEQAKLETIYVKGHATKEEVTSFFNDRGYDANEQAELFTEWEYDKRSRIPTDAQHAERELSKADIVGSFVDGISSRDEAKSDLLRLRYTEHEAETLLRRAELKAKRDEKKAEETIIENELLRGSISEDDALGKLDGIGIHDPRRKALVSSWLRTKHARTFEIPLASVEAMVARDIMSVDEGRANLLARGASQADAERLLKLWNEKAYDAEQRAKAAEEKKQRQKKETEGQVIQAYIKKVIQRDEAKRELLALGYDEQDSDELLAVAETKIKP